MTTHLVISDQHAHPDFHNDRADWLGNMMADLKPDVVINIGDAADMASLSTYDKGKRQFQGRNYKRDIEAHLDFQERLWNPLRKRKCKLPASYFLIGNHEERISRAIDLSPELDGAISLNDLKLKEHYDCIVDYSGGTPGVINIEGISYAHYFVGGIAGRPLGGLHAGYAIATKKFSSATCGHSHLADVSFHVDLKGNPVIGCVVGVYQDYDSPWAGEICDLWWRGVVVKRNVDGRGGHDPQFISLDYIKKTYG